MDEDKTVDTFDSDAYGNSVGITQSGDHTTVWDSDSNSRMSWDSDKNGDYAGGGHSVDQETGEVTEWS